MKNAVKDLASATICAVLFSAPFAYYFAFMMTP